MCPCFEFGIREATQPAEFHFPNFVRALLSTALTMNFPNFFAELKRRNVFRAAAFYAATAWLLVQVATQVFPFFQIANWLVRWIIVAAAIGFPFWILFAWLYQWTPQGLRREQPDAPLQPGARQSRRNMDRWIMAMLAIAVVLLLTDKLVLRERAGQITGILEKSVAVLPMINSSADPANEYFSDGMSEEFISSLGHLPDLKVVGRTSSFQFKGKSDDSKTIGEKLGVSYLLEGSVQRSADRVRIWVRLIKSGDGANVWSETYDRDLQDIFAVQSEIAGSVAKELKIALLGNNRSTVGTAPSNENLDAYNAFLQGNFYAARHSAEDFRKAIGYYEKAVQLDPRYALAYANLSNAASNLVYNFGNPTTKEGQEIVARARETADTALRLDPNLSEAHLAKGTFLRIIDLNYAAAEGECRRALELAPKNAGALLNLALLKGFAGDFKEALKLTEKEMALDPLRSGGHMNYAMYLAALGRFDEAEATLQSIARRSSGSQTYMALTRVEIERGQPGAALEAAKKERDPFFRTYALAIAYFASGNQTQADVELKKLIDEDTDDGGVQIASIYALRKEPDKVFEWLERAWLNHDPGVSEVMLDPFLRTCKDDPRFIAFAQKIGVMPKAATHL